MSYDRTVVDVASRLLLLNIARAHRDQPLHFTTVSSIAATYNFTFNAGVGPAMTGDLGYLHTGTIGGSVSENPTMTITPMQGDEFTQRLLTPFERSKTVMLLQQGYDIDALLRLMTAELRMKDEKGVERVYYNRPSDKEGYPLVRRVLAHLSSVQDRHTAHVEPLKSGDDPMHIISNYDPALLPAAERHALEQDAAKALGSEILIDIRAGHPGGEYPIRAVLRLRSFFNILAFVGHGISAEPEFHVDPDPRTPPLTENPDHTLEVVEASSSVKDAEVFVDLGGKTYSLKPDQGYRWNKKAFSLLYQLFQMSVAPSAPNSPLITIAK